MNEQHILPPRDYYYLKNGRESVGYRNHLWNEVIIKKMIRNEVYIGHMVQNKQGTVSYKNHKQIDRRNCKPRTIKGASEPSLFGTQHLPKCVVRNSA